MRLRSAASTLGIALSLCLAGLACSPSARDGAAADRAEVWIYTSLYKHVVDELEPQVAAAFPGLEVRWYQAGSEVVAAKVEAELLGGGTRADLLLTADPFWYLELHRRGLLEPYASPAAAAVAPELRGPGDAFVTNRIPVIVLGYNSQRVAAADVPGSFAELAEPRFRDRVSMGSPLESGTTFTATALLARRHGWEWFARLREGGLIAAGGNSSVVSRLETGERPIGILLLENVLAAMAKGSPVRPIYPTDGAIPVPSPIAIVRRSGQPAEVRQLYDWFFGAAAQRAMVASGMYSPLPGIASPPGAMEWQEMQRRLQPWTPELVADVLAEREAVKRRFTEVVLR
jgi:iron(III) transport system substrate-binding protein